MKPTLFERDCLIRLEAWANNGGSTWHEQKHHHSYFIADIKVPFGF